MDDLVALLGQLLKPDTELIKKATHVLKDYFKRVQALENLLILMSQNPDNNIRQVSCVYLRKIITNLWSNLSAD
jgi:hypothetical protein